MNTRIRYIKETDGSLKSGQYLKGDGGIEYVCGIYPDGTSGYIASGTTVIKVQGPSSHKVKIAIKKQLEALGVEFVKESREGRSE